MMLSLLATSFVSSGCNDDGNETISLEFGNIKTMIIGRWYTNGGVYWEFYEDYYTRSDKGPRQLRWLIDDTYNGNNPYFGDIYLDGIPYRIISMGGDSWVIEDSGGGTIDFTRDGSGTSGNNGGNTNTNGSSILVKRIEKRINDQTVVSVDFVYDSRQLVSKATYTGNNDEVWPCSPGGTTCSYSVTGGTLKVSATIGGRTAEIASAKLDTQNHITELNFYEDDKSYYGHNSKGQCTSHRYGDSSYPCTYTWENDCIKKISGNPGGTHHTTTHSTTENKANLNLNWMIDDQMFSEDQLGLALCGYISSKEKYLYDLHWKLDNGRPVSVQYDNYTYYIYYY